MIDIDNNFKSKQFLFQKYNFVLIFSDLCIDTTSLQYNFRFKKLHKFS